MDPSDFIFIFLLIICLSGLVVTFRRLGREGIGWAAIYVLILGTLLLGRLWHAPNLFYLAAGIWVVFVLTPTWLAKYYYTHFSQQRYAKAYRFARVISLLHPMDGWRDQPQIVRALKLAQEGDLGAARAILEKYRDTRSTMALGVVMTLFRMSGEWEELLTWERDHPEIHQHPQYLPALLRARGEVGEVGALLRLFMENRNVIAQMSPAILPAQCRLMLFAFCGKVAQVENLFRGTLSEIPAEHQRFWMATAQMAAGDLGEGRQALEFLSVTGDRMLRTSIQRRLNAPPRPVVLDPFGEAVIAEAAREESHEQALGTRAALFSKEAIAVQILIALNLLAFGLEMFLRASTDIEKLIRLGAAVGPLVHAGQKWRLVSALFLHYGGLHVAMNMFALAALGPFVELALGSRKFVVVYFVAGIASMAAVVTLRPDEVIVGASGAIMGLVGSMGAIMLRGWLQHKASLARKKLRSVIVVVLMQTMVDALIPEVSMTAHLSGFALGFLVTLLLRDRLDFGTNAGGAN